MSNQIRTKEDVQRYLGSLEDLHRLKADLATRGKGQDKTPTFYIFGRFSTFSSRLVPLDIDYKARYPDIPDVLTSDEFHSFLSEHGYKGLFSSGGIEPLTHYALPPAHVVCSHCGRGWNIDNCWDAKVTGEGTFRRNRKTSETIKLDGFEGKTLGEARDALLETKDKKRVYIQLFADPTIFNEKLKDPSAQRPSVRNGFRRPKEGLTWDYVIESGDEMNLQVLRYYHRGCYMKLDMRMKEDELFRLVRRGGFTNVFVEAPRMTIKRGEIDSQVIEDTDENAVKSRSFTIHTNEGTFGMAFFDPEPPVFDISEAGLTVIDLMTKNERSRLPPGTEGVTIFPLMDGSEVKRIRRALAKKNAK